MKQWNGLLKKEWVGMKGWVYGLLGASVFFIFVLPFVLYVMFGATFMAMMPFLVFLVAFTPGLLLLVSLGKETVRPDVWLHSPASVFKLFGAKAFIAAGTGAVQLLISSLLLILQLSILDGTAGFIFDSRFLFDGSFTFLALFYISLVLMCYGLLFRVVYIVIRTYTKVLTGPVMIGLAFLAFWVANAVTKSAVYENIANFGPIGTLQERRYYVDEAEGSYFWLGGSSFYIGEIVLNVGFIALLFVTASVLFEKKVRL